MKKQIFFLASILSLLFLVACSEKEKQPNYQGYWLGEENMIFEVKRTDDGKYTISNINGSLNAEYKEKALRGKNSLDMDFSMEVKGDSAFYTFGSVTTSYKRIDADTYKKILATQLPAIQN
ncbi:MAG TPA: hypothetical protein GX724_04640 [Fibrobacter sp.]|nr:hypothetical protein [Fibrobacter sp.]